MKNMKVEHDFYSYLIIRNLNTGILISKVTEKISANIMYSNALDASFKTRKLKNIRKKINLNS